MSREQPYCVRDSRQGSFRQDADCGRTSADGPELSVTLDRLISLADDGALPAGARTDGDGGRERERERERER